jgi:hypothetical protein
MGEPVLPFGGDIRVKTMGPSAAFRRPDRLIMSVRRSNQQPSEVGKFLLRLSTDSRSFSRTVRRHGAQIVERSLMQSEVIQRLKMSAVLSKSMLNREPEHSVTTLVDLPARRVAL